MELPVPVVRVRTPWIVASVTLCLACESAPSARDVFERDVVPVLESRCTSAACHGVGPQSEAQGEQIDWDKLFFHVDEVGVIVDMDHAYETTKRAINTVEDPKFSSLLRKPLAESYGGTPHFGRENFRTPAEAAYLAVRDWIAIEDGGGEDPEPLGDLEQLFADTVQPVLAGASCMAANCHGPDSAVPFRLDPGIGETVPVAATRANYEASLGMLAFGGEPLRSRLLAKMLPLHAGGIVHKGGNAAFMSGPGDPRVEPIVAWACEERRARLGEPCASDEDPLLSGFVFVRGPIAAHNPFDLDQFVPGTDLFLAEIGDRSLVPARVSNLTGAIHDGPVDIRDPAVDHLGQHVLFAMRDEEDEGHAIYELTLATGAVEQLTQPGGTLSGGGLHTDRDPTYAPDGHVWFVSTRAGVLADSGRFLDADLYELDRDTGEVTQRTFTPHVERKPCFCVTGKVGGEVCFSALRDAIPGQARAHSFRFPPDLHAEYHQHFGITPPENFFYDTRELADGRYVTVIGDLTGVWGAGRLGVVDRNFGPEINAQADVQSPGLPFYAPPLARLDVEASATGITAGMYRDPVGLPDGRVLTAYAPGPIDLGDPQASPDLRIDVIELREWPDGRETSIGARRVLVDEAGVADRDPEPVFVRRPAPIHDDSARDRSATTGVFIHQGMPMIDALLANLYPSGPKLPRDDFAYVRVIESLPTTPAQRQPVAGVATTASLSSHGAARILAELPLAADGSFQMQAPARVPFRLQQLNAERMSTGVTHNRWYYLEPDQTIKQGVADPQLYVAQCGACHGAADGDPAHVFVEADVMTMASVTGSRFVDGNPRHPIPPTAVDESTAITVDFMRDVQPLFDRSCATGGCHAGLVPAAALDLTKTSTTHFTRAYEALLADGDGSGGGHRYVDAATGSAERSFLIEKLLGRELGAPRDLANEGVPHPTDGSALSDSEMLTLIRWIDLGATFHGVPGGAR